MEIPSRVCLRNKQDCNVLRQKLETLNPRKFQLKKGTLIGILGRESRKFVKDGSLSKDSDLQVGSIWSLRWG